MSMGGIAQRRSVDGQIAVKIVIGVEYERHANQDRPYQTEA